MFSTRSNAGAEFLEFLRSRIDLDEFRHLAKEGGFSPPNTFTIEDIIGPILDARFPAADHYEFEWAIYECGLDNLRSYTKEMRIYLCAIYMYCNKVRQWGISIESEYHRMAVTSVLERSDPAYIKNFITYLEWLFENVEPDQGYEDYFCLLSWIILQRVAQDASSDLFDLVMSHLSSKNYSVQQLSELSVIEQWNADWLQLSETIPLNYGHSEVDYKRIICGSGV